MPSRARACRWLTPATAPAAPAGGDGSSCTGCTDSTACNYDPDAWLDDGSCIISNLVGDFSQDGLLNVLDVVAMVNYILGDAAEPTPCASQAGNVNDDDTINILDVFSVVGLILGN